MTRHYSTPEAAFEARTIPSSTGCIEWSGAKIKDGYGMLKVGGISTLAHRYSFERSNGVVPAGKNVLHTCDNPSCVNPDHLFLGTDQTNVDDMFAKGRGRKAKGSAHGRTSLTDDDVRAIRADPRGAGLIAKDRGMSKSAVAYIRNGTHWGDVV